MIVSIGFGHIVLVSYLFQPVLPSGADCGNFSAGYLLECVNMMLAEPSETDDAASYLVHYTVLLNYI
jgi:hypothetical protein